MTPKVKMEKLIHNSYKNIGGIVVLQDGVKQYEYYMNDCTQETTVQVFSVTKSIVSLLIGIAMDKGYLKSLDQKVLDFFPEYKVKQGETTLQQITLKDMMTMTVPYKFKSEPYVDYFGSDDWVVASLDRLGGKGKIGEFRYAPVIGPDIFTGILKKATGQSVNEFATKHLFQPLQIVPKADRIFANQKEQMEFYKEKDPNCWVTGPSGVHTGGWGLCLTAMDLAKIGQVYLNNGQWENQTIVSEQWIQESTEVHSRCKQWDCSYGYLWWILDENQGIYAAMGDSGNIIYVNPKKKLVVAVASLFDKHAKDIRKLICEYIDPMY